MSPQVHITFSPRDLIVTARQLYGFVDHIPTTSGLRLWKQNCLRKQVHRPSQSDDFRILFQIGLDQFQRIDFFVCSRTLEFRYILWLYKKIFRPSSADFFESLPKLDPVLSSSGPISKQFWKSPHAQDISDIFRKLFIWVSPYFTVLFKMRLDLITRPSWRNREDIQKNMALCHVQRAFKTNPVRVSVKIWTPFWSNLENAKRVVQISEELSKVNKMACLYFSTRDIPF